MTAVACRWLPNMKSFVRFLQALVLQASWEHSPLSLPRSLFLGAWTEVSGGCDPISCRGGGSSPYCLSGRAPGVDGDIEHVLVDGKPVHFETAPRYTLSGETSPACMFLSSRAPCMAILALKAFATILMALMSMAFSLLVLKATILYSVGALC